MQQIYSCLRCHTVVSYGQRACHNCGMILNWTQPVLPPPHFQQNPNQQQMPHHQPLWHQPQPYNHSYPINQPPPWQNNNQYWPQDAYLNPAAKTKKWRLPRFVLPLMVPVFVVLIGVAVVLASNGNMLAKTLSELPLFSTSSSAPTSPTQGIGDAYKQALVAPFNKAGAEITDPSISSFYQKVVAGYALNGTSGSSEGGLSSLVPNLKKIFETALNTSLKEVGAQIEDKGIADFYNNFLQQIGVK